VSGQALYWAGLVAGFAGIVVFFGALAVRPGWGRLISGSGLLFTGVGLMQTAVLARGFGLAPAGSHLKVAITALVLAVVFQAVSALAGGAPRPDPAG